VALLLKNRFSLSRFNEGTYLKDLRFTDGGGSKKILANIALKRWEFFPRLRAGKISMEEEI
jgi:hypothetical protein